MGLNSLAARALGRIGKPGLPALVAALKVPHADWWAELWTDEARPIPSALS